MPPTLQAQIKKAGGAGGPVFLSEPCEEPGERVIAVIPQVQVRMFHEHITVRRLHIHKNNQVETDEVDYSLATIPACIQQSPEGFGMGSSWDLLLEAVISQYGAPD